MSVYSSKFLLENFYFSFFFNLSFHFNLNFWNQLCFSISILSSIALKRWNFPDNLDFKGKIVAKFLLRSHFLSIYGYMATKQQTNHGSLLAPHCSPSVYGYVNDWRLVTSFLMGHVCLKLSVLNFKE